MDSTAALFEAEAVGDRTVPQTMATRVSIGSHSQESLGFRVPEDVVTTGLPYKLRSRRGQAWDRFTGDTD
jgi:hypothetical protein